MNDLIITANPFLKLRGLLGRPDNTILLMENCRDIHTYTMTQSIDVVFLDESYKVIDTYFGLRPRKRVKCDNAKHVIERFSNNKKWATIGESIFSCLAAEAGGNINLSSENSVLKNSAKNKSQTSKYKLNKLCRRNNESMPSM